MGSPVPNARRANDSLTINTSAANQRLPDPWLQFVIAGAFAAQLITPVVTARGLPRRQQTDEQRARTHQHQCGANDPRIERRVGQPRDTLRALATSSGSAQPCEQKTRNPASGCEHETLGEHLPDDAAAASADRGTNCEFSRTRRLMPAKPARSYRPPE